MLGSAPPEPSGAGPSVPGAAPRLREQAWALSGATGTAADISITDQPAHGSRAPHPRREPGGTHADQNRAALLTLHTRFTHILKRSLAAVN